MKNRLKTYISIAISFTRLTLLKVFHGKKVTFHAVERFSPSCQIEIGKDAQLKMGARIRAHGKTRLFVRNSSIMEIGHDVYFGYDCIVVSRKRISIGNNVEFGPRVLLYDNDHDYQSENGIIDGTYLCSDIIIGDNCWIGASTIVLRGTQLGNNCIVAAGSVIKGTYPDNTLIVQKRTTSESAISSNPKERIQSESMEALS